MAKRIFKDAEIFWAPELGSAFANQIGFDAGVETNDPTTFNDDTRIVKAGLRTATASMNALFDDAFELDDFSFNQAIGVNKSKPLFVAPRKSGAGTTMEGDLAYLMNAVLSSYSIGATIGELLGLEFSFEPASPLGRGKIVANRSISSDGSTGTSQLGSVESGETLIAALNVYGIPGDAGDTLDVTLESDDGGGVKTTQITFDQVVGDTKETQFKTSTQTTTDSLFNAKWNVNSASGNWKFAVAAAVVPAPIV